MNNLQRELITPFQDLPPKKKRRSWIGLAALTLVVLAAIYFAFYYLPARLFPKNKITADHILSTPQSSVKELSTSTLPQIPIDIPIEPGAILIKNYTFPIAGKSDGRGIEFISRLSEGASLSYYEQVLPDKGWQVSQITSVTDPMGQKQPVIAASKGGRNLVVRIYIDLRDNKVHVIVNIL